MYLSLSLYIYIYVYNPPSPRPRPVPQSPRTAPGLTDAAVALRVRGTPKPCGWPQALGWRKKYKTMSDWGKRLLSAE